MSLPIKNEEASIHMFTEIFYYCVIFLMHCGHFSHNG
jgi:hypothetical protein